MPNPNPISERQVRIHAMRVRSAASRVRSLPSSVETFISCGCSSISISYPYETRVGRAPKRTRPLMIYCTARAAWSTAITRPSTLRTGYGPCLEIASMFSRVTRFSSIAAGNDPDRLEALQKIIYTGALLLEASIPRNICKNFFSPMVRASSRKETYKDNKKTNTIWTAQKCGQIISSQPRSTAIFTL